MQVALTWKCGFIQTVFPIAQPGRKNLSAFEKIGRFSGPLAFY